MKDYRVITHHTPPEFEKLVSEALNDGWQLVGGVSTLAIPIETGRYQTVYSQALAK